MSTHNLGPITKEEDVSNDVRLAARGASAYEHWLSQPENEGSVADFLASLKANSVEGDPGAQIGGIQETHGENLTPAWFQRLVPLATVTTTEHDSAGRLSAEEGAFADGSAGSYSASYDSAGRLSRETYTHADSAQQLALVYDYDNAGRLKSTNPQVTNL